MLCDKCKMTDMKVEKVEDNKMYFKCRCCGNEKEKTVEEVKQFKK